MGAVHRDAGALSPLLVSYAWRVARYWVTFAPCFLWIFLGAPYVVSGYAATARCRGAI
jgi:chromate transporter